MLTQKNGSRRGTAVSSRSWSFIAPSGFSFQKLAAAIINHHHAMSVGEGSSTPLQYSCLENPMDGGAWRAAVHGVAEGWTCLSDFTFTFHFHALEKEMTTHSSVLAWRIPGMGEPGGLPSMGSHRVGHDWSDLACNVCNFWLQCIMVWIGIPWSPLPFILPWFWRDWFPLGREERESPVCEDRSYSFFSL